MRFSSTFSSSSGDSYASSSWSGARSGSEERIRQQEKSAEKIGDTLTDLNPSLPGDGSNSQAEGNAITSPATALNIVTNPENNIPMQVIDREALEVLGKHQTVKKPVGPPICEELVSRWSEILNCELPKEDKEALLLKYGAPINFSAINPPKLNPEVKASLTEPVINRDTSIIKKKDKVVVCISALGAVLSKLLCGETVERLPMIEVLFDTEKLLIELQREASLTRKALIVPNVNAAIKDTLNATAIDEWLFGNQLDEKIKTAKSLELSSKQIKAVNKGSTSNAAKNFKSPFQQNRSKQQGSSLGGQRKSYSSRNRNYRKFDSKNVKFSQKKRQLP